MQNAYKNARNSMNMTVEKACMKLYISKSALNNYESGRTIPPAEVVKEMASLYQNKNLTLDYCRHCPIGKQYGYTILNNVDDSMPSILIKLIEEMDEAKSIMGDFLKVQQNKMHGCDFSVLEKKKFEKCIHEILDLEHTIEVLKVKMAKWIDLPQLIQEHNEKCIEKKYVR